MKQIGRSSRRPNPLLTVLGIEDQDFEHGVYEFMNYNNVDCTPEVEAGVLNCIAAMKGDPSIWEECATELRWLVKTEILVRHGVLDPGADDSVKDAEFERLDLKAAIDCMECAARYESFCQFLDLFGLAHARRGSLLVSRN